MCSYVSHRFVIACILFALVGLPAAPLKAQSTANEADGLFRSLDANSDGKLSLDEARDMNRRMFEQIFQMANKSGTETVSRAEFQTVFDRVRGNRPVPPGTPPQPMPMPPRQPSPSNNPPTSDASDAATELPPVLRRVDANRDGKLSRTEWGRVSQMFTALDTNKDGQLDAAELNAAPTTTATDTRASNTRTTGGSNAGPGNLTGTWRGWVVEGRGENPNAGQMQLELVVAGNSMRAREVGTNRVPQGALGAGNFVISGPNQLDATQLEGQHQGKVYQGIFQMRGDELWWCVANRVGDRPTELISQGATSYLLVLRRVGP